VKKCVSTYIKDLKCQIPEELVPVLRKLYVAAEFNEAQVCPSLLDMAAKFIMSSHDGVRVTTVR
jgi:hypothetical protein